METAFEVFAKVPQALKNLGVQNLNAPLVENYMANAFFQILRDKNFTDYLQKHGAETTIKTLLD